MNKLRNGKTRKNCGPSRQVGIGRVLSRQALNEGLKKLEIVEAARVAREQAALEQKLAAEERKNAKQAIERQHKIDLDHYNDQVNAWREEVAILDAACREERDVARLAHERLPKKPTPPIRPKRPVKLKGNELTIIQEVENTKIMNVGEGEADTIPENHESEELSEFMRDLDLDRFEQMI